MTQFYTGNLEWNGTEFRKYGTIKCKIWNRSLKPNVWYFFALVGHSDLVLWDLIRTKRIVIGQSQVPNNCQIRQANNSRVSHSYRAIVAHHLHIRELQSIYGLRISPAVRVTFVQNSCVTRKFVVRSQINVILSKNCRSFAYLFALLCLQLMPSKILTYTLFKFELS